MDANGLRSFGLGFGTGLHAWRTPVVPGEPGGEHAVGVEASHAHRVAAVRLASRAPRLPLAEARASVAEVALEPAMAIDATGSTVRWDAATQRLVSVSAMAATHALAPVSLALPEAARAVSDLALGADGVLYLAAGDALWLLDPRGRFEATRLDIADFAPQRLGALPGGGVIALDVGRGRLARVSGLPMPTTGVDLARERDHRFDACERNPTPLAATVLPAAFDATEKPIAVACSAEGATVVLTLGLAAGGAALRMLRADATLAAAVALAGPRFPHTVGWLDAEHIAIATQGSLLEPDRAARDPGVLVYPFPATLRGRLRTGHAPAGLDPLRATGDYYPLAGWSGGPFVNAPPSVRLHYPRSDAPTGAALVARISAAERARYGMVANYDDARVPGARIQSAIGLVDTRDPAATWHRLYVEACVPCGTAMVAWLAATDQTQPPFTPAEPAHPGWHPHVLGDPRALPPEVRAALGDAPRAAWAREASEVAFGESLLAVERERDRSGLFAVLIQRAGLAVRALRGRRLWIAVELFGDGRASPELVALRAYASRVSYRDRYLPALYHETTFGPPADRRARATAPDFLERLIHLFEGTFTAIEDKIAAAWMVTDPRTCPPDALPWLASWIGVALEPGTAKRTARRMIASAPRLAERHGTLDGIRLALDIATEGGVATGRIVVVEHWRLRRTLATILGADLADADDPLTAGIARSGNSFVGDSLFLGDEGAKAFLALFREPPTDERDAAIHALYDGLAGRVTVLVHEEASADELGMVRRIAESAAPAHVLVRVATARYPFMVGVASLVGADTYLVAADPPQPVRLDRSRLGRADRLEAEASLDAHGGAFGGVLAPASGDGDAPIARVRASRTVLGPTQPLELDGSDSSAAPGRSIALYRWAHRPPQ